jgi:hypothetical protein
MPKKFILLAVLLCLVGMTFSIAIFQRSTSKQEELRLQETNSAKADSVPQLPSNQRVGELSSTPEKATSSSARIVNQWLTAEGKTVVVEKEGRRWTNLIPDTMLSLTDEQILELVNVLDAPPPPRSSPAPDTLNKRLLFYGLTLDDQTNLLPGVTVTGLVTVAQYGGEPRHLPVAALSDAGGRFEFDIADGQALMLAASKGPDYIPPPWQWFQYSPMGGNRPLHQPSPIEPVPFVLTRKLKVEPLFEVDRGWAAPNTGEPVRIDLTTGKTVATGGDLIVSIHCPEPYKAGDKIPWKLVLSATGGGLVPAQAERLDYMLQAPAGGYQEFVIEYAKDADDWVSQFDGVFYLKARDSGLYAKLRFDMHTQWDERGVLFGVRALVNTNASRNLQMPPK